MTTDTTPTTPAAPVHEPFARPGRTFLQDSVLEDVLDSAADWDLACVALDRRSFAVYHDDPHAEEARRIGAEFTAEEARRVDAFLAAGVQDVHRLDAIAAATDLTGDDRTWLLDQLRLAWQRLDRLRDVIDSSGAVMNARHPARAVDYVRWSRKPQALSPLNGARLGRPTTGG
ncbi:hypothetical protein GCM10010441_44800 [Kitasatospora paracochleata]|uniref:Uncharacterized protein n=1 Tax=Kitasatospora paracochleata TaxID=58354 RepID=A0ABT1J9C7_9ACTN|nr:hypothetical protein [Kitasatospora paracochleata]MCP2314057.1 hypothetical protein [Kitasatospora paracochleata]